MSREPKPASPAPVARLPEERLLERARKGDVGAFEALVAPHVPTVRRLAYSFTRNWSDADDLAQDALLRAYRSIASFEGRSAFSTWLYVVVRSAFLDAKRGRRRPEREADGELEQVVDTASEAQDALVERKDETERLWAALERLDPIFRIPLVFFAVEGMSYEEIAAIEDVPIGTVRSRIARARAQLGELLAAEESGGAGVADSAGSQGTAAPQTSSNRSRSPSS
ncbi:MAG: sigma-70 family RNA polymerase sigma factor [Sandaracinus sp.]